MLAAYRANILLSRGLLLFIVLMLCMSLCVLAASPAEAEDTLGYLKFDETNPEMVTGINKDVPIPDPLVIPDTVTEIGRGAFYGVKGIKKIEFPFSLQKIGESAFAHCSDLTDVTIPGGVEIGSKAFLSCTSLSSVKILYGGSKIGTLAFSNCSALSEVELASDVSFLGSNIFTGVTALKIYYENEPIDVGGNAVTWEANLLPGSEAAYEYTVLSDKTVEVKEYHGSNRNPKIPDMINGKYVTAIAANAFSDPTIESVYVPPCVTTIKSGAFHPNVILKGYAGTKAEEYGSPNKFINLNKTDPHTVTVAEGSKAWLRVSYGKQSDGSDANYDERGDSLSGVAHFEIDGEDEANKKENYITVWIEQTDDGSNLLESICVQAVDIGPGDVVPDEYKEKSAYFIMAKAQEAQAKLDKNSTAVSKELVRYTFEMPEANIEILVRTKPITCPLVRPEGTGVSPGVDQEKPSP